MNITKLLGYFQATCKEYGCKNALKITLDFVGLKNYTKLKLPFINEEVSVRPDFSWFSFAAKTREVDCVKQILKTVKQGMVVLDIGAHVGIYTLLISKLVGEKGCVVAFEPSPQIYRRLQGNIEKNHILNIVAENIAVADYVGEVTLFNPSRGSIFRFKIVSCPQIHLHGTGSSILKQGKGEKITVKCTTLDHYCKTHNLNPDLIKIDVEGAEMHVIKGAEKTLLKYQPAVIMEFHGFEAPQKQQEMWTEITKYAKSAKYIDGLDQRYKQGDEITSLPLNDFHTLIQYKGIVDC